MRTFYETLHVLAQRVSEENTVEWTEGDPGYSLTYQGHLEVNYPWVYLDFEIGGSLPLKVLLQAEAAFKNACENADGTASYWSAIITINSITTSSWVRFRLTYREDL